jgi:hypothetical protein
VHGRAARCAWGEGRMRGAEGGGRREREGSPGAVEWSHLPARSREGKGIVHRMCI